MSQKPKSHKSPHHAAQAKNRKSMAIKSICIILILGGVGYGAYFFILKPEPPKPQENAEVILNKDLAQDTSKKGILKELTGAEFRDLYNNFAYPNTEIIAEDAVITGNTKADQRIQELAEKRGYVRRSAPVSNTFKTVQADMQLQERAAEPWLNLQAAAKQESINLDLTAAYRSAKEQREIFLERIGINSSNYASIASGAYDTQINQVLAMTAIPGYSRHHTGYTIDIGCQNQPTIAFENTVCFEWLSANNYKNAKNFGWIPSYPEGAGTQGPEPESWEYVWVGKDVVTE